MPLTKALKSKWTTQRTGEVDLFEMMRMACADVVAGVPGFI
jgi:hypothetical protein